MYVEFYRKVLPTLVSNHPRLAGLVASSDSVRNMTLDENGVLWFRLVDGYARYGPPPVEEN